MLEVLEDPRRLVDSDSQAWWKLKTGEKETAIAQILRHNNKSFEKSGSN